MVNKRQLLKTYKNGNYYVRIYDDGTKVRVGKQNFAPKFPENIDIKITSYCDGGCPMCHEDSSSDGTHADLAQPFLDTLVGGTELAIGGGNPLAHPDLERFLIRMQSQGVVCNITVRQTHLFANVDYVQSLIDRRLVHGVGISFTQADEQLFDFCRRNPNCVIHLILGMHGIDVLNALADKGLKVLWLGYKRFGRGAKYYSAEVERKIAEVKAVFYDNINRFTVVSLDNAAMNMLDVAGHVSPHNFARHYMGDEGRFTMYIDLVKRRFAINSVTPENRRFELTDNITTMFAQILAQKSPDKE